MRQRFSRWAGGATAPPGAVAAAAVLMAALVVLRSPERLLHPQFYAEDGCVFFKGAWEQGFLRSVLEPYSGYLHVVPRLAAGCALLVPLVHAPLVINLWAFLLMVVPVLYLLSDRMRSLPSFGSRVACAALFVMLPASQETHLNITNAHWYLLFAACFIVAAEPPVTKRQLAADTLVLGLSALSSPLAALVLPPAAARAWRERRRGGPARQWLLPAALGLGVALQAATSLAAPRVARGFAVAYDGLPLVREFVMFGLNNALLGMWGNYRHLASFGTALYLLGFAAWIALATAIFSRRSRLGILLLYAAVAVFAIEHVFPANPGSDARDDPGTNLRYYVVLVYGTLFAARHAAVGAGFRRYLGAAVLAAAILVGIPGDYFFRPYPDTHYADQVAVFQTLAPGAAFAFPVIPANFGPMVLRQKDRTPARPLLAGRSYLHEPAAASLQTSFSSPDPGAAASLTVLGAAYDKRALKPPGGVLVVVDGRLFPACTADQGRAPGFEQLRSLPEYRRIRYWREIPVAEIGPGRHELSLIVMTHDRRSYYQPTAQRTVTVP